MLKKEITYADFDKPGEKITQTFHFNLTNMEMWEVELQDELESVSKSNDPRRIVPALKRIIKASVGQRVGNKFVKSEEFANEFMASDAYSELLMELFTGAGAEKRTALFIKGIVPEDVKNVVPVPEDTTEHATAPTE